MKFPVTIAFSLSVMAAGTALAGTNADVEGAKALRGYVLTMDKVKHFGAAVQAAGAAMNSDPSLKAEAHQIGGGPQATLAQIETNLKNHPRVMAFYARQGLNELDAIAIPITLIGACMAAQAPQLAAKMANRVSDAQIAFCKAHLAELRQMHFVNGG